MLTPHLPIVQRHTFAARQPKTGLKTTKTITSANGFSSKIAADQEIEVQIPPRSLPSLLACNLYPPVDWLGGDERGVLLFRA